MFHVKAVEDNHLVLTLQTFAIKLKIGMTILQVEHRDKCLYLGAWAEFSALFRTIFAKLLHSNVFL